MLAPDVTEVGASGWAWDRESILDMLRESDDEAALPSGSTTCVQGHRARSHPGLVGVQHGWASSAAHLDPVRA
ncbi:hypothetical protein [Janibacter alittae]|uniref:Uncharacterized protein n=1 Tax=Janibacter alittae TaxID=3115209 RepID=A0ABZ2ML81_9MICO